MQAGIRPAHVPHKGHSGLSKEFCDGTTHTQTDTPPICQPAADQWDFNQLLCLLCVQKVRQLKVECNLTYKKIKRVALIKTQLFVFLKYIFRWETGKSYTYVKGTICCYSLSKRWSNAIKMFSLVLLWTKRTLLLAFLFVCLFICCLEIRYPQYINKQYILKHLYNNVYNLAKVRVIAVNKEFKLARMVQNCQEIATTKIQDHHEGQNNSQQINRQRSHNVSKNWYQSGFNTGFLTLQVVSQHERR